MYNHLSAPYNYTQTKITMSNLLACVEIKLYCSAKENADEIHWSMKSVYMNKIRASLLTDLLTPPQMHKYFRQV